MIELVRAIKEGIPEVIDFVEAFYAIDGYPFDVDRANDNVDTFISNEQLGRLWLIQLEGQSVGYVAFTFGFSFEYGGRDAFIDELYIDKAHRSKGYGKAVLNQLDIEAKALGIRALHLEVEAHNEQGQELYRKSGFDSKSRVLMTKSLD